MRPLCICVFMWESVGLIWIFSFGNNQLLGSSWTCCTSNRKTGWVTETRAGPWKTSWEPAFIYLNPLPTEYTVNHGKKSESQEVTSAGLSHWSCLIIAQQQIPTVQNKPDQTWNLLSPGNQAGGLATPNSCYLPLSCLSLASKIFAVFQRLEAWTLLLLGISWCFSQGIGPFQDEMAS